MGCRHGEGSSGRANWDARVTLSIESMCLCGESPFEAEGLAFDGEERFIAADSPDKSTLWLRAIYRGSVVSMPPLASRRIDTVGVELLQEWIEAMDSDCVVPE